LFLINTTCSFLQQLKKLSSWEAKISYECVYLILMNYLLIIMHALKYRHACSLLFCLLDAGINLPLRTGEESQGRGYGRLSISFTDQTETVAQLVRKCTPFLLLLTTTSIYYLICCVLKYLLCLCMSKINKVIHCHGRAYHCRITHLFVLDYCFHNKLSCLDNRSSEG
jgi:hypothetical protein